MQANIAVKYYWTDNVTWSGTSGTGRSVPVRCVLEGEGVDPIGNTTIFIGNSQHKIRCC